MSEFKPGDRVQDVCWDGQYVDTVNYVFKDGDVSVRFDGGWADIQMSPNQLVHLEPAGSTP